MIMLLAQWTVKSNESLVQSLCTPAVQPFVHLRLEMSRKLLVCALFCWLSD